MCYVVTLTIKSNDWQLCMLCQVVIVCTLYSPQDGVLYSSLLKKGI